MKRGGGHSKGAAFERKICKQLSLWWTEGERDDVFWRTSVSGGRATSRLKQGKKTAGQYGDITYTDPVGKPLIDLFTIELKCGYGTYDALDLLDSNKQTTILSFWIEATKEADQARNKPLLIFKRDRREELAMYRHNDLFNFAGIYPYKSLIYNGEVEIVNFAQFLDWLDPKVIREKMWYDR